MRQHPRPPMPPKGRRPRGFRRLRVRLDIYDPDQQTYLHIPGSTKIVNATTNEAQEKILRRVHAAIESVIEEIERERVLDRAAAGSPVHPGGDSPADRRV